MPGARWLAYAQAVDLVGLTWGICDSPTSGLLWLKLHNFAELHIHDVRISWIETNIFWIDTRIFWVEARWISTPSVLGEFSQLVDSLPECPAALQPGGSPWI